MNMPSQEEILSQQDLLTAHRQTLSILLKQQALQGEAYARPELANSIRKTRSHIQRLKAILRGWGIQVIDQPNDTEIATEQAGSPSIPSGSGVTNITQTAGDNAKQFGQVIGNITFERD